MSMAVLDERTTTIHLMAITWVAGTLPISACGEALRSRLVVAHTDVLADLIVRAGASARLCPTCFPPST